MKKRVLFVCVENSNRSQMAEGFARTMGADAYSAGSRPSGEVNPTAMRAMAEVGIDITRNESKGLDDIPKGEWDWVVTMGCGDSCPHVPAKNRDDWELPDPKTLPYEQFMEVRDEIARRVRKLLDLE